MNTDSGGISIVICCYNSSGKIEKTLNHLALQVKESGIEYQIVLVDNNCTDNTVQKALDYWILCNSPFPLTLIQQPKPGLNFARQMGISTAMYNYIVLCDDDNWLSDDYLQRVYHIFETQPEVAIAGGVGEAVFGNESESPPKWFEKLNGFGYAIGDEGRKKGFTTTVYGAGMAIRKNVFEKIAVDNLNFILTDRKGKSLSSGGDIEICIMVEKIGFKIFFDPALKFKHFIAGNRLSWNYYLHLRKSFGKANAYLMAYHRYRQNQISKTNFVKKVLLYIVFVAKHLHYFLFPNLFQNAACASFIQELAMRQTLLLNNKKIIALSESIQLNLSKS